MESHSEFAAGKFLTKDGKIQQMKQWEELATQLNALSTGTKKSTKQWQTVDCILMYYLLCRILIFVVLES